MNFSSSKGFIKKATGPIARAVARAARSSRAVITITRGRGESAHIRARIPNPVTPSIHISVTTTDTGLAAACTKNSADLLKARAAIPSEASKNCIERSREESSSTRQTSTGAFMLPGFSNRRAPPAGGTRNMLRDQAHFPRYLAAVGFNNRTDDRQSHPHSGLLRGKEMVEDFLRPI